MRFKTRHPITPDMRREFAVDLGRIVCSGRMPPYMPNEGDDTFWTVDEGNDWKIQFYPDKLSEFEVRFRYDRGNPEQEKALAGWLVVKWNVEVIS